MCPQLDAAGADLLRIPDIGLDECLDPVFGINTGAADPHTRRASPGNGRRAGKYRSFYGLIGRGRLGQAAGGDNIRINNISLHLGRFGGEIHLLP